MESVFITTERIEGGDSLGAQTDEVLVWNEDPAECEACGDPIERGQCAIVFDIAAAQASGVLHSHHHGYDEHAVIRMVSDDRAVALNRRDDINDEVFG